MAVDEDIDIAVLLLFATLVVVVAVVDEILFVTAVIVDVYFGSIELVLIPTDDLSTTDLELTFGVKFSVVCVAAICGVAFLHLLGDVIVVTEDETAIALCGVFDIEVGCG